MFLLGCPATDLPPKTLLELPSPDAADAGDIGDAGDVGTADGEDSDGGAVPNYPLAEDEVAAFCQSSCAGMSGKCGAVPEFVDPIPPAAQLDEEQAIIDICAEKCAARIAEHGHWAVTYACLEACDQVRCLPDGPLLPIDAECVTVCADLSMCGLSIDIAATEGACLVECSVLSVLEADATHILVQCIQAALATTCDAAASEACAPEVPPSACEELCGTYFDAASSNYCADQPPFLTSWPTLQACVGACGGDDSAGALGGFAGCLTSVDCRSPERCAGLDGAIVPAAGAACVALQTKCPGPLKDFETRDHCAGFLTGFFTHLGGVPAGTADCIQDAVICTSDPGDRQALLLACALSLAPVPEPCATLCPLVDACVEGVGEDDEAVGCLPICLKSVARGDGLFASTAPCVTDAAAAADCDAVFTCLEAVQPPSDSGP